jgi:hypothetical protein
MSNGHVSVFVWNETANQLGFQVTLPDGREFSVDMRQGRDGILTAQSILRMHEGLGKDYLSEQAEANAKAKARSADRGLRRET